MTLFDGIKPLSAQTKQQAIEAVIANARHDRDYYFLLLGAILLALGAIFTNSIPVLIASMIVAPLATPILLLGLSLAVGSRLFFGKALGMIALSIAAAIGFGFCLTWAFGSERVADTYISFASNHLVALLLAMVSGAIAAYGMVRPRVASAITGVAIAVSLMPPLVATGVSLAPGGAKLSGAFVLFLLNLAGITLASAAVFTAFGLRQVYHRGH